MTEPQEYFQLQQDRYDAARWDAEEPVEHDELAAYDRLTRFVKGRDERCRNETGLDFNGNP